MSTIHSPFKNQLIVLISILIVFSWFFSWIALGDVYLFLTHVGKKSQCCRRENWDWNVQCHTCNLDWINWNEFNSIESTWVAWLYHHHNPSRHVTDGVTVTSHSASLLQKISVDMNHLCQITFNCKLSHIF
jgi:hypothetical protein